MWTAGLGADALVDAHIVTAAALRFFMNLRGGIDAVAHDESCRGRGGFLVPCVLVWAARDILEVDGDESEVAIGRVPNVGFVVDRRCAARRSKDLKILVDLVKGHFRMTDAELRVGQALFLTAWGREQGDFQGDA